VFVFAIRIYWFVGAAKCFDSERRKMS
jgi:hypothetical protein